MFNILNNLFSKTIEIKIKNNQILLPEEYITGIPLIDSQHLAFFTFLNNFQIILEKGSISEVEINKSLIFLYNYIDLHFKTEETILKQFLSDSEFVYKNQFREHKLFIQKLEEKIQLIKEKGINVETVTSINKLIANWFIQHIKHSDIQLRKKLKEI